MKKMWPLLMIVYYAGESQPLATKIPDSLVTAQQWKAAIRF